MGSPAKGIAHFLKIEGDVMDRKELEDYIQNYYSVEPDYPWIKYPDYEVFRHTDNKNGLRLLWKYRKTNSD